MKARAVIAAALLGLLAGPAAAHADNTLTIVRGDALFRSEDPGIANEVTIEHSGNEIRFFEPKDPFGINFPANCRPGRTQGQYVIEVFCPKASISTIAVDIGPGEDKVGYKLDDVPGSVGGGSGADAVTTAGANDVLTGDQGNDTLIAGAGDDDVSGDDGNDVINAGEGNDKVFGGSGADTIDAGAGDDTIRTPDGVADKVNCGAGTDTVIADTLDELVDCENVQRQFVSPPADAPAAEDHKRPRLDAGGASSQRIRGARRWITILATSSERGLIQAAGFVSTGGIYDRVKPVSGKVTVAGGGAELKLSLNNRQLRLIRRDFRKHRTPRVRVTISCVDAAGNTSRARHFWISLRH